MINPDLSIHSYVMLTSTCYLFQSHKKPSYEVPSTSSQIYFSNWDFGRSLSLTVTLQKICLLLFLTFCHTAQNCSQNVTLEYCCNLQLHKLIWLAQRRTLLDKFLDKMSRVHCAFQPTFVMDDSLIEFPAILQLPYFPPQRFICFLPD